MWRLLYKSRLTLLLLVRFLDNCWSNRVQFFRELIALLSLRQENFSRATASLVTARVEALKFVFDMVGVPFPFFQAVPLSKVDLAKVSPDGLVFTELQDEGAPGDQRKIVCLTPLGPDGVRPPPGSWPLPLPSSQQQRLRRALYTHDEAQSRWWSAHIVAKTEEAKGDFATCRIHDIPEKPKARSPTDPMSDIDSVSAQKYRDARQVVCIALSDFTTDKVCGFRQWELKVN